MDYENYFEIIKCYKNIILTSAHCNESGQVGVQSCVKSLQRHIS